MERVRIGIVGLNFGKYIVHRLLEAGGNEQIELVAVCDADGEKARAMATECGVTAYTTVNEILADDRIESVGLFTGPNGRAGLIRQIIGSGRHVYTTKPFERNAQISLDILTEAQRMGIAVYLNSPTPHLPPDLALVEKWRIEFDLGRPVAGRFDVWASYNETADGRWYDDPAECPVAPIFRIGMYVINDAVRLFGTPEAVTVLQSRIRTHRPTPDNAQLGIRFVSGAIANIYASFCVGDGDEHRNGMILNFERGTIYRNAGPVQNAWRDGGTDMALVKRGRDGRYIAAQEALAGYHPQHTYEWSALYNAVRSIPQAPTVTPETVAAGIAVVEAMTEASVGTGSALVTLPTSKGEEWRV